MLSLWTPTSLRCKCIIHYYGLVSARNMNTAKFETTTLFPIPKILIALLFLYRSCWLWPTQYRRNTRHRQQQQWWVQGGLITSRPCILGQFCVIMGGLTTSQLSSLGQFCVISGGLITLQPCILGQFYVINGGLITSQPCILGQFCVINGGLITSQACILKQFYVTKRHINSKVLVITIGALGHF